MLEPDYYQLFPCFTERTVINRILRTGLVNATFLLMCNIDKLLMTDKGRIEVCDFLRKDFGAQRRCLTKMLSRLHLRANTMLSLATVPREAFTPTYFRKFAYLDSYIPFSYGSCLTAPGLIALMIDAMHLRSGQRILEIGIGSGYHAACVSEAIGGNCFIFGIENNPEFFEFGKSCLEQTGYTRIVIAQGDGTAGWPETVTFDRIYIAASFEQVPDGILYQLIDGGIIQGVRPLTQEEFTMDTEDAWLFKTFGTYESYIKGDWRRFACLFTAVKRNGALTEIARLYDVSFVPLQKMDCQRSASAIYGSHPFAQLEEIFV